MSSNWDEAIEERLVARNVHPIDKAAADMGLTLEEYEQYLSDIDEQRYLAEWAAAQADKPSLWQRITSKLGASHG